VCAAVGGPRAKPGHSMRPAGHTALGGCAPGGARAPPRRAGSRDPVPCMRRASHARCGAVPAGSASMCVRCGGRRAARRGAAGGARRSLWRAQLCVCTRTPAVRLHRQAAARPGVLARAPCRRAPRQALRLGRPPRRALRVGCAAAGAGQRAGRAGRQPPSRPPAQELHRPARARGLSSGDIGLGRPRPGACTPRARGRLGACRPPGTLPGAACAPRNASPYASVQALPPGFGQAPAWRPSLPACRAPGSRACNKRVQVLTWEAASSSVCVYTAVAARWADSGGRCGPVGAPDAERAQVRLLSGVVHDCKRSLVLRCGRVLHGDVAVASQAAPPAAGPRKRGGSPH